MDRRSIIIITAVEIIITSTVIIGTGMLDNEPVIGPKDSMETRNLEVLPETISDSVGSTVTWYNNDTIDHTVTSNDDSFASSGIFASGASYSVMFTKAGECSYHFSLHPSMNGRVVVN